MNISRTVLHEKFEELLRHLSLKQSTVDQIVRYVNYNLRNAVKVIDTKHKSLRAQLTALDVKKNSVDEKLFDGVINNKTYKKWILKLNAERAKLNEQFEYF